MKVVVAEACGCELFRGRHFAGSTKRTRLSEADVVEQNTDHVRPSLWGFDLKTWRRFDVARVKLRNGWRLRLGNRQHRAVKSVRGLSQSRGRGEAREDQGADNFSFHVGFRLRRD